MKVDFEISPTGFKVVFYRPEDFGGLSGGLSGGLNEALSGLLEIIKKNPGIKAKEASATLKRPLDTVDKQVKYLISKGLVERRGSKKTGGYFAK